MSGKLKYTGSTVTPNDPMSVKAYCAGRQFAKDGGTLTYATGVTGVVLSNNSIAWTADTLGDGLMVRLVDSGAPNTLLRAVADASGVTVVLGADGDGLANSTAAEVIAAIAANAGAAAIVSAANNSTSNGTGVAAAARVVLTGSSHPRARGEIGVALAAGHASWTANPSGVTTQDCCALPYGGGFGA